MSAPEFGTIEFAVGEDRVATITLARPDQLNAFNQQMAREMAKFWARVRDDDALHAVVLRAAGERAFCTGIDVKEGAWWAGQNVWNQQDAGERNREASSAAYLAQVANALRRLEQASAALRANGNRRLLRLSVLPSFAGNWLVPRLPGFERAHPGIDVVMEATTRYADFAREPVDLAIRFGTGPWKGVKSEPLLPLDFYPVCWAGQIRGEPPLRRVADLARHTWLEEIHVPKAWRLWLEAAGAPALEPIRWLQYDHAQLMLDAAVAGQGVALAFDLIAERYLRERRLVRPFRVRAPSPFTYHLVLRTEDRDSPPVRAFRDWIVSEMAAWRRRLDAA